MKRILIAFLVITVSLSHSFGQVSDELATTHRIENYLSDLEKVGFYGSVLVEFNHKKIISKGYGFSDREKQIKNSPNTVFDIGSITKQFTAAAILKLEMEGKLSTQDTITKYFDNIPSDKKNITLHDLLRHQSGLISNVGNDFDRIREEEFLNKVFSSALRFDSGTGFNYSNIGYSLLAMIVEKVSGQSYETFLYENLWKPAQMEMTGYTRPDFDKTQIAVGYFRNDSIWGKPTDKEWDKTAPYWHLKGNGGILSTTEDMYKWYKALMTDNILSKEAKQKSYHPQLRPGETDASYYAYGWNVSKTNRNTFEVKHNGSNQILFADFFMYPGEGIAFIMLSNKSHPNFNRLNFELSKIIFTSGYKPEIPMADNSANRNFTIRIINLIKESGIEKAKTAYVQRDTSEHLLEFMMREEGFNHIDNSQPAIAIQIFEMNVFAYPESAPALQGLGEGYMETGNSALALKYLEHSLKLKPDNPFVINLVKKLEKKE